MPALSTTFRSLLTMISLSASLVSVAQPIGADRIEASAPVVVVVRVAKPWYAPRAVVVRRMREQVGNYDQVPGLAFKAFSLGDSDGPPGSHYGGLYWWRDRASASRFFDSAWFERVQRERGVAGEVRFFEVLAAVDNQPDAPALLDADAVGTLVLLPTPAGNTREGLLHAFEQALPTFRKVPGLLRTAFIVTNDGRFGGLYQWSNRAAADAWFNASWRAGVRNGSKAEPTMEWFDLPILLPSKMPANRLSVLGLSDSPAATASGRP